MKMHSSGAALAVAAPSSSTLTADITRQENDKAAVPATVVPVILGRERLLGVPEVCEITGFADATAARLIKESGYGIRVHSRLFVLESSFFNYLHKLEVTDPCTQ